MNRDGDVDMRDVDSLLHEVLRTSAGDANLDGRFDSADLIQVMARGKYENDIAGNASWSDGDWNLDGKFTSSDLILALQQGVYAEISANPHSL